jgi:lysylphosphatidylglycerol synthetase-like protein (DUF2156 family)
VNAAVLAPADRREQPPAPRTWRRPPFRDEAASVVDHPSGFLAFSSRNRIFTVESCPGFIAYREQGRHIVAFGGVHAPREWQGLLLDLFLEAASRRRRHVMVVQLREGQRTLFTDRGFTVNPLGTSFAITLRGFSMGGTRKMKLRNKIKRARGEGLTVEEVGRELPRSADTFGRLREISAEWLAAKGKKELDFMIGELGDEHDTERRIFVVSDRSQQAHAFITYVPVWGERPGVLHDLTRKRPTAAVGALELCNAFALERFVAEGKQFLHFGFTPFIVEPDAGPGASRILHWLVLQLNRYGQIIYPSQSQASYKLKWGPDILEQEYVAARRLSPRAVVDLLMLTRAV